MTSSGTIIVYMNGALLNVQCITCVATHHSLIDREGYIQVQNDFQLCPLAYPMKVLTDMCHQNV